MNFLAKEMSPLEKLAARFSRKAKSPRVEQRAEVRKPQPVKSPRKSSASSGVLAVEVHDRRISMAEVKVQGRRVTILRTVDDVLGPREEPAEKAVSMARALGLKKARLYVVASPEGVDHRFLTLPPMGMLAMRRFLSGKLSADLQTPAKDLVWAVAGASQIKSRVARQTMAAALRRESLTPWSRLEDQDFPVEVLTTPEMALYAVGRQLAGPQEALYIYPGEETSLLAAAGPSGPFFMKTMNGGKESGGFPTLLQEELRYTMIYLQQHQKKTLHRTFLVGRGDVVEQALPAASAASGGETACLGGEDLVLGNPSGAFLAAALPAVKDVKSVSNLLSGETATRRGMSVAALTLALAAGLLFAVAVKQFLDIGLRENRLAGEVRDLEHALSLLRYTQAAAPNWQAVEKKAVQTVREMEDLQVPPWPRVLEEIALATPRDVRFDSLSLSKGGKAMTAARSSRQSRPAAQSRDTSAGGGWVLSVKGNLSGRPYPALQKSFRTWYETLLTSPYLHRVDVGSVTLRVSSGQKDAPAAAGEAPAGEMQFTVTGQVQNSKEVDDVLQTLDRKSTS